ncbi:Uncharacterised protein [Mycobacteroides abscessus subsp. abscessus]|nr:Uncharacterised protein [Mycobacteroides abscessus subsp. abscessus]
MTTDRYSENNMTKITRPVIRVTFRRLFWPALN